jgi:RimJ/RimL family protein N-acetyltransferase
MLLPLIGDFEVARNMSRVPYPYTRAHAEEFVQLSAQQHLVGSDYHFAITLKSDETLLGGCGLHKSDGAFELGYWIGKRFWGNGFATEAARALVNFAFHTLDAARLVAGWFHDNPASGRVLSKLGCTPSGVEQRDCLARGHAVYCHMVMLGNVETARP